MSEDLITSADELLRRFLGARSEAESAKFLDLLMENCVMPTIKKILRVKFGGLTNDSAFSRQNYEDLHGDCCVKILGVLRLRKISLDAPPIRDFSAYCAAIVYNVWNSFVRENSPKRESLKNKIRYALDKDQRFIEEANDGGEKFYKLRIQRTNLSPVAFENLTAMVKAESEISAQTHLPDVLALIFEKAGGGLKIETVVKIVADLWQVRDFPHFSLDVYPENPAPPDFRSDESEMRYKLEYIWQEIRSLPVLQRASLLYNLRDERGGEMLFSFFNTRLATLSELADAMSLTKTELVKLLPHLPFDDKKIAGAMNLTVKQIGNLRKSARDSLRRRLEGKAKRKSAADAKNYAFIVDDNNDLTAKTEFLN